MRPDMRKIGASKKYDENFFASSVADDIINFKSLRFFNTHFNTAKQKSHMGEVSFS